ncbi:aromatic ring-hydroxylating dioxygenase subunit alpha [Vibrio sp. B1FLJ16]|uniref:aromatic ring-hydroxylating oxygenase subunit alpha n=1 Tax=Vibrio sp. B1FLJ16 TaxID=2751178 RepID=UPI0015F592E2|nr:aromatic ring-hydroxylating dioxygenase subunit alpha [Vibrio sp. B1FLJ16]CAD7807110.1 Ring hydroxylating alpha subunit (catalytic domain) [Vibrio sp. B1FLJ16]CAE6904860.1 Ring hydroxylating alpha subunit (catalytic domain) [Vibrio sp. B1FLJ16]
MSKLKTFELINQRQPRYGIDRELYISEDVFQQDLELIWHKEWIFAGHTFEIDKPGEYFTLQVGQYPVIVVRGEKGEVRAFHNVCRHRGSRICQNSKGKNAKLVCPYHKWTFGLDGKLLYAGSMGETFKAEDNGLTPVHCEIVNSYIYICVADDAPDFEKFRQDMSPFTEPHNLENCKVAYESNLIEKGNWKIVFENNRECFHCDGNHPELLNSFVENLSVAGIGAGEDPELEEHWNKCEQAGLPSRLVMDENGQYRMTRIPLSAKASSYTMSGKPAVNRRLDTTDVENIGALLYFLYPSNWNHFLGDHALSFRVLPMSTGETLVTTKWLVPKDAVEGVDYDIDDLTKVWLATNDQDRQLVEETYRGLSSPAYIPGPFSDIAENGVCQFVDWYCETMKSRLNQD